MLTKQRLRLLQVGTKIGDDLSISLTEDSSRRQNQLECFAANYLMGSKGLRELARGGKVFRDDVPELEYRTARIPYAPSRFHETIQGLLESPGSVIDPSYRTQIEGAAKEIQETNVRSALAK
jgi:hypothetical protein